MSILVIHSPLLKSAKWYKCKTRRMEKVLDESGNTSTGTQSDSVSDFCDPLHFDSFLNGFVSVTFVISKNFHWSLFDLWKIKWRESVYTLQTFVSITFGYTYKLLNLSVHATSLHSLYHFWWGSLIRLVTRMCLPLMLWDTTRKGGYSSHKIIECKCHTRMRDKFWIMVHSDFESFMWHILCGFNVC